MRKPTAIGVAIAAMLASIALVVVLEWRGAQPASVDENELVELQGDFNMQQMQENLTDQINSLPPSEAQQRMESETGLALSQRCIQWTELHENFPSDENRESRDKACGDLRNYVETGTLPEDEPSAEGTAR